MIQQKVLRLTLGWVLVCFVDCDSPPAILRDPQVLKLLATHYPGTVLQPGRQPSWQSDGSSTGVSSGQYGTRIQTFQTSTSGPYVQYTSPTTSTPSPYLPQRWVPVPGSYDQNKPAYRRPGDAVPSYSMPQHSLTRPVYYLKPPMYLTKNHGPKQMIKLLKMAPNKYAYRKTVQPYYRRYVQAYEPKSKPGTGYFYEMPASFTTPKTNLSQDLHDYFHTTERSTSYLDRPITERASNISYYDTYEDNTDVEVEESKRGYYGDRLYMSTQKPEIDRQGWATFFEEEDDDGTVFD